MDNGVPSDGESSVKGSLRLTPRKTAQINAAARLVYPTRAASAPLPAGKMVPLTSPASLSKTTSKSVVADLNPTKPAQPTKFVSSPADTSYCRYLGSLVTKLHREVALPQLIADCGKAIVENAANQTGWNYMILSIAANWALNGMSNTTTQLAFIGLQLSTIPLFVTIARMLVVLTPKHHVAVAFAAGTKHATREHIDKMMANVPNKQNADEWLKKIHLTRDHPILLNQVHNYDAISPGGLTWSFDRKGSYVPTTVFWSLCLLYLWTSQIAKQNLLYVAFVVDHLGTFDHVFVDTNVSGLWHHVNTNSEIDAMGFCAMLSAMLFVSFPISLLSTVTLYCLGVPVSGPAFGIVAFAHILGHMILLTNHYFQHGRSKQRLPKLIRRYLFKGFLWKCDIFVDDLWHKKHHFDSPEDNFAMLAGFMDKLVYKTKLGQTLYMHNPKLNYAMFSLYWVTMGVLQVLCTRATSTV